MNVMALNSAKMGSVFCGLQQYLKWGGFRRKGPVWGQDSRSIEDQGERDGRNLFFQLHVTKTNLSTKFMPTEKFGSKNAVLPNPKILMLFEYQLKWGLDPQLELSHPLLDGSMYRNPRGFPRTVNGINHAISECVTFNTNWIGYGRQEVWVFRRWVPLRTARCYSRVGLKWPIWYSLSPVWYSLLYGTHFSPRPVYFY